MKLKHRILVHGLGLVAAGAAVAWLPAAWCTRGAGKWMDGDLASQLTLARGVEQAALHQSLSLSDFRTGSSQFSGEWLFGTYLMTGIGFGQMALEHPELRKDHSAIMGQCIDRLLTPEVRAFDRNTWGEDPLDSLEGSNAHAAYLGYLNLLLGLHRWVSGDNIYTDLNNRITASLVRKLMASQFMLIDSYPGEMYPVDNCFVIGSIGLHQRVTGEDHRDLIARWLQQAGKRCVDPETGLLFQVINPLDGSPADEPRGSGTALAIMPVHYADPQFARSLYAGLKKHLARTWLGFGAVREYPGAFTGDGDIDSGPIIFGYGLSATGFAIAGARRYGDEAYFKKLFASAHLCGVPFERNGHREYMSGGALGNAILFAMLTAPRAQEPVTGANP